MQNQPIKKSFFQRTTTPTSHYTKANEQSHISSATTYCELAVHLFFFEKTSVLRLHYGNPFAPIQSLFAGVLQAKPVSARAAGSSCKITSDRALNRGSQGFADSLKHGRLAHVRSQFSLFRRSPTHKNLPPATFCTSEHAFWFFLHDAKRINRFPFREAPRLRQPQISAPQPQLRTATIKTFLRKLRGSANLETAPAAAASHSNN